MQSFIEKVNQDRNEAKNKELQKRMEEKASRLNAVNSEKMRLKEER